MSSPQVAGLAGLLLSADPTLTPAEVRQIIRDGAIDFGPAGFDGGYGHGRIDVLNSLLLVAPCNIDADCDDALFCNGAETCGSGTCQLGMPLCDDTVACTVDSCSEPSGSCDHVPDDAACDDGLFCNGAETCDAGVGCLAGSDPCPGQPCNESAARCGLIGEGFILSKNADFFYISVPLCRERTL